MENIRIDPGSRNDMFETLRTLHDRVCSVLSDRGPWEEERDGLMARSGVELDENLCERQLLAMEETVRELLGLLKERGEKVSIAQCGLKEKERLLNLVKDSIRDRFKDLLADEERFEKDKKLKEEEHLKEVKIVEESRKEIDLKEKKVFELERLVDGKLERLKVKEGVLETVKDKIFRQVSMEFDLKEEQLRQELIEEKKKVEDFVSIEFDLKEELLCQELNEEKKKVEDLEKRLKEEVDLRISLNEAASKQNDLEHQKLQEKSEELRLREKELNEKHGELELKERRHGKQVEESLKEIKRKEKKIEEQLEDYKLKKKRFERRTSEVELMEKKAKDQNRRRQRDTEEWSRKLELKENRLDRRSREIEERSRELELKENQLDGRLRELELKEKSNIKVKVEPEEYGPVNGNPNCSGDANLRFCVDMDGIGLQIYLNERWKEHDSMKDEVFTILHLSSDPAKLVLDAMQGFYPPHLKKGDLEFDDTVVMKTCILLLEQLMRISPKIKDDVKKEAMKLSYDWIKMMIVDANHSLEALGFLQLVIVYGLANEFAPSILLSYLGVVAQHSQVPKLLRALSVGDEISGFIQYLVENHRQVDAVKFVQEFELAAEYPLVPLLKDYLEHSENAAKRITNDKNRSLIIKNEARGRRIADVKAALKCIEDHKLESEFPPDDLNCLKMLINTLEDEIANSKETTPTTPVPKSLEAANNKNTQTTPGLKCPPHQAKKLTKKMSRRNAKVKRQHQAHVEDLIKNHKHMDTIKYIYEWKLVEEFPPVPYLKDFLAYFKTEAEDYCKTMNNSISSQLRAIGKEMHALQQVIGCIKQYELENEYPSTVLEERINELKNQQREKEKQRNEEKQGERQKIVPKTPQQITPSLPKGPQPSHLSESGKTCSPRISAPGPATVPGNKRPFSSTISPEMKQPQMENGNKRPHVGVSENQFPNQQPHVGVLQNQFPNQQQPHIGVFENQYPNQQAHIGVLQNQFPNQQAHFGDLQNQVLNQQAHNGCLQNQFPNQQAQMGVLQNQFPNQQAQMGVLQNQFPNQQADIGVLQNQFPNQQPGSYYDPHINSVPMHFSSAGTPPCNNPFIGGIPSGNVPNMLNPGSLAGFPPRYDPYMVSAGQGPFNWGC